MNLKEKSQSRLKVGDLVTLKNSSIVVLHDESTIFKWQGFNKKHALSHDFNFDHILYFNSEDIAIILYVHSSTLPGLDPPSIITEHLLLTNKGQIGWTFGLLQCIL